jgi:hypothetical protein
MCIICHTILIWPNRTTVSFISRFIRSTCALKHYTLPAYNFAFCGPSQHIPIPKEEKPHVLAFRPPLILSLSIAHYTSALTHSTTKPYLITEAHTTWNAQSTKKKSRSFNKLEQNAHHFTYYTLSRMQNHAWRKENRYLTEIRWIMIKIHNELARSGSVFITHTRLTHISQLPQMTSHANSTKSVPLQQQCVVTSVPFRSYLKFKRRLIFYYFR